MPDSSPIRIGVLFSDSGLTAVVERTQRDAVLMAIEEINAGGGVLGRELAAVHGDPRSDPRVAAAEATRLMDAGVKHVFGCYMSSIRRAVLPVIERRRGLLFYPTLYEGFEYSDHCIYSGAAPNQNSVWLADYMMRRFSNPFYFVGSNYVFPYESNRIMRDYITQAGGAVLEERYLPLYPGEDDIARVIADIRRRMPVTIFSTTVGDATLALYRAYDRAGLDRAVAPICSLTTGEAEIAAMGAAAGEGHFTAAPYFRTVESARNARFVTGFAARHGESAPISACAEAAYVQVLLFAEAAARAEAVEVGALRAALPMVTLDAPQGPVRVDASTQHTHLWPRVGVVNMRGDFDIVEAAGAAVAPDPYMIETTPRPWGVRSVVA